MNKMNKMNNNFDEKKQEHDEVPVEVPVEEVNEAIEEIEVPNFWRVISNPRFYEHGAYYASLIPGAIIDYYYTKTEGDQVNNPQPADLVAAMTSKKESSGIHALMRVLNIAPVIIDRNGDQFCLEDRSARQVNPKSWVAYCQVINNDRHEVEIAGLRPAPYQPTFRKIDYDVYEHYYG